MGPRLPFQMVAAVAVGAALGVLLSSLGVGQPDPGGESALGGSDVGVEGRVGPTLVGSTSLMVRIRKNANQLTAAERDEAYSLRIKELTALEQGRKATWDGTSEDDRLQELDRRGSRIDLFQEVP